MNTIINVECVDQELIITNSPTLASGGICENIVSFKFCNKWDGFSKTAVFYQNEKNVYYSLINDQNECEVPHEVTMNEGTLYLGVFGVNGDARRTSKVDKIRIHKGAWNKDMHPSDPTPDIYTQLQAEMNRINDLLHSFLDGTNPTPVGNAKTLEGHGASYFATALSVENIINGITAVGNALQLGGKGASEYITKDGGTVNTTSYNGLTVKRTDASSATTDKWASIAFRDSERELGAIGFNGLKPIVHIPSIDGLGQEIIHAGNHAQYGVQYLGRLEIAEKDLDTLATTYKLPEYRTYCATISPKASFYDDGTYLCGGGSYTIIGMQYGNTRQYGYQIILPFSTKPKFRQIATGTWGAWKNLFFNDGGTVNGNVTVKNTNSGMSVIEVADSGNNMVGRFVANESQIGAINETAGKWVFTSTKGGTNTFFGTASGNLPTTGGTVDGYVGITYSGGEMLNLKAKQSNISLLGFNGKDGKLGFIGFNGVDGLYRYSTDGSNYKIFDTGNSAKVTISDTAPTEMSGLWAY